MQRERKKAVRARGLKAGNKGNRRMDSGKAKRLAREVGARPYEAYIPGTLIKCWVIGGGLLGVVQMIERTAE